MSASSLHRESTDSLITQLCTNLNCTYTVPVCTRAMCADSAVRGGIRDVAKTASICMHVYRAALLSIIMCECFNVVSSAKCS